MQTRTAGAKKAVISSHRQDGIAGDKRPARSTLFSRHQLASSSLSSSVHLGLDHAQAAKGRHERGHRNEQAFGHFAL